jgi:DNA-directed RNA polymerase subunit M/transcription elongation factor TFIIS
MFVSTTYDSFLFKCNKCANIEIPKDSDTLRYENVTGTNLVVYKSILLNAGKDPVNPKVKKNCSCGNNIVTQVRLGNELKLINTCINCNNQWVDGTQETD